ncbi:hypothetical protein EZJ58_3186 [Sodalis ligni]|uniref:Uncharacterized protein n=1 Tax=Sodalis ligni TaxID=2697027 RepID=A0A4R1NCC1_9GAMM|nr:hypothetical protein EZJ58_3186 [Sodalis ligni]
MSISLLVFLTIYWSLVIFTTIYLVGFAVAVYFFLTSDNPLYFDWLDHCILAAKKGSSAGSVLGIGIWIEAKLRVRGCPK